jgi:small-conductance mechanosensitive channel
MMIAAATTTNSAAKGMAVPNSIIKGRLTAFLSKFLITPTTAWHICHRVLATLRKDVEEIITIVIVYKFAIRIAQKIYQLQHKELPDDVNDKSFQRSKTLRIARALKEVAQLFGLIIALEFGLVLLEELDFEFVRIYPVYQWTCSVIASIWGAKNLSEFKDFVISRGGRVDINKSAGRKLLSRFLDVAVYGSFTLVVLDFLSVQTGYALKSLFGLSSVGTLVFSLASKELVGEFLAGLAIQGTNMYTGTYPQLQPYDGCAARESLSNFLYCGWVVCHRGREDFAARWNHWNCPKTGMAQYALAPIR